MTETTTRRIVWLLGLSSISTLGAGAAVGIMTQSLSDQLETPAVLDLTSAVSLAAFPAMGILIASRQPMNRIGWLFGAIGLVIGVSTLTGVYGDAAPPLPGRDWAAWATSFGIIALPLLVLVMLLFPDGRLPSRRWRIALWIDLAAAVTLFAGFAFTPGPIEGQEDIVNPLGIDIVGGSPIDTGGIGWGLLPVAVIAAAVSLAMRYRRSRGIERQQLKWFVFAGAGVAVGYLGNAVVYDTSWQDSPIIIFAAQISLALVPIAAGVAILKYRLYDIDVVINKALVYGSLAIFITAVYVVIVVGIGSVVGSGDEPNLGLQIASTAVVAVAFQPVRERVQRLANGLVYGSRATPYEVMAGFSRRVTGTLSVQDVLHKMAEAAGTGIGARRARVRLLLPNGERVVAWPDDGRAGAGQVLAIPVGYRGEPIGEIAVEKPPGEPITPAERALLDDLASQAGLAMHNVRLTEELAARAEQLAEQSEQLRRSRERLVTARDVQRRRLERDIREGPQQRLLAIGGRLREATGTVERDPQKASEILDDLTEQANSTLEGLRDLARGIFPPLLADRGIVPALQAHVRKVGADAMIDAAAGFTDERFDPDTEATVYFCCLQAIQNVVRHAGNARATVRLDRDGDDAVVFAVHDDGPGFDLDRVPRGMGLQIMQDRIDALGGELEVVSSPGGGTTVTGRVPARAIEVMPS